MRTFSHHFDTLSLDIPVLISNFVAENDKKYAYISYKTDDHRPDADGCFHGLRTRRRSRIGKRDGRVDHDGIHVGARLAESHQRLDCGIAEPPNPGTEIAGNHDAGAVGEDGQERKRGLAETGGTQGSGGLAEERDTWCAVGDG